MSTGVIHSENPAILRLPDFSDPFGNIKESLTYTDKSLNYQYQKARKSKYLAERMGEEKYKEYLAELKAKVKNCLLLQDENGFYTYAGLAGFLKHKFGFKIDNRVKYPEPSLLPWKNEPPFKMYPYQVQALEALLEAKHASVSIGTGLGKSYIIFHLLKTLGLRAVVMTPSTSISEQLYKEMVEYFGVKYVGKYFDGKKEAKKLFTVANAQSLTKVKQGTKDWEFFQGAEVFIADESHQCPANTLASVCFEALSKAKYRFFMSATQMRNDGRDLLLDGIIGDVVYSKTVREGVDEGYLAKPLFKMVKMTSPSTYESVDANKMTRKHLYYNPLVAEKAGHLASMAVLAGMPTVVLIKEVEQFTKLLPYIRPEVRIGFAHGPLDGETDEDGKRIGNMGKIPKEYWDSDPTELVKQFNEGKLDLLVGTSCISTGTNIKPVKMLIYWQGGQSEIQVKQAIGRSTRLAPGKKTCVIVDFEVRLTHDETSERISVVARHADYRRQIYNDLYGPVKEI